MSRGSLPPCDVPSNHAGFRLPGSGCRAWAGVLEGCLWWGACLCQGQQDCLSPTSGVCGLALHTLLLSGLCTWHAKHAVQSLSRIRLFATPWTAARQASLSFTNSWSLLKPMSIESVMPSNHLILCHPFSSCLQSFPASGSFPMSQLFASGGQTIGASASVSVLPMNIQA